MKDNKLILFDWGNIVESHTTGYNCYNAYDDLFHKCGYQGEDTVFTLLGKYKLGVIPSVEEFENTFNEIKEEFNFSKTYDEFIKIYKDTLDKIDYYRNVADYEKSLGDRCYIGIFSNLTVFDKERLDKQVDLSKYDYAFLSFEMGMKKPSMETFEYVQSKLPFKPEDILFIDDREDNIESGKSIGWNVLQATGLEFDKIKEKCEEFLD